MEGWYTMDADPPHLPHLLGNRCTSCGTVFFPRAEAACRNPACRGDRFEEVELSRRGRVWSYTTNHYAPPPPFVAPEPFEPYTIAAVELAEEKMVVLGQVDGDASQLRVGAEVELVLATLFEDEAREHVVWKWRLV